MANGSGNVGSHPNGLVGRLTHLFALATLFYAFWLAVVSVSELVSRQQFSDLLEAEIGAESSSVASTINLSTVQEPEQIGTLEAGRRSIRQDIAMVISRLPRKAPVPRSPGGQRLAEALPPAIAMAYEGTWQPDDPSLKDAAFEFDESIAPAQSWIGRALDWLDDRAGASDAPGAPAAPPPDRGFVEATLARADDALTRLTDRLGAGPEESSSRPLHSALQSLVAEYREHLDALTRTADSTADAIEFVEQAGSELDTLSAGLKAARADFDARRRASNLGNENTQEQILARMRKVETVEAGLRQLRSLVLVGTSNGEDTLQGIDWRLRDAPGEPPWLARMDPDGADRAGWMPYWMEETWRLARSAIAGAFSFAPGLKSDHLLALAIMSCGLIGTLVAGLRDDRFLTFRQVSLGLAAGFVSMLAIKGGRHVLLVDGHGELAMFNAYGAAFVGLLSGLFSEKAYSLLKQMVDTAANRVEAAAAGAVGEPAAAPKADAAAKGKVRRRTARKKRPSPAPGKKQDPPEGPAPLSSVRT